MSARDWSTIGVDAPPPRWLRWAAPPPLIPLAAMAWIATHWDRIPLRYATHFGKGGRPDGWTTRTPLHVYGVLIFGAGLAALMVGLMLAIWFASRRPATLPPSAKILVGVAYMLGILFTTIGLIPLVQIPPAILVVIVLVAVLGLIVYAVKAQSGVENTRDDTPKECWSVGGVYYNPKDPSLFVPARVGYGYTFNMANPWTYRIIVGFLLGVGILVAFLIWSLR